MIKTISQDTVVENKEFVDGGFYARFETYILSPEEQIYSLLLQVNDYGKWLKGGAAKLQEKDTTARIHSHFNFHLGIWPFQMQQKMRVVDMEQSRRIVFRLIHGDFVGQIEFKLKPYHDGSLVEMIWQRFYPQSLRAKLLMKPEIPTWHESLSNRFLMSLKKEVEKTR